MTAAKEITRERKRETHREKERQRDREICAQDLVCAVMYSVDTDARNDQDSGEAWAPQSKGTKRRERGCSLLVDCRRFRKAVFIAR